MLPTPCWITSDTHLGAVPARIEQALVSWLRAARTQARSVVLNGDIFDFWYEWRHVMPRHGYRVIAAIADLTDAGLPVIWQGGNHDAWGGELLRTEAGVDFRLEPWRGPIGAWTATIEHGDGLREVEDRTYRRIRTVLRNRAAMWAFRWIHPDLSSRLALGTSHTSRTLRPEPDGDGLRALALARLAAPSAGQLVVFGHTHTRELLRGAGGGVYANPGGWFEAGPAFLRVTDEAVELRAWSGSGEGERLDALDRLPEEARGL